MEGTTWFQEAKRRLGVSHPAEQLMKVLDRVEALEKGLRPEEPEDSDADARELTRSEKMKLVWARRKNEKTKIA